MIHTATAAHKAETNYHMYYPSPIHLMYKREGRLVLAARMHKHQSPLLFPFFYYRSWADPISVLELSQIKESTHNCVVTFFVPYPG